MSLPFAAALAIAALTAGPAAANRVSSPSEASSIVTTSTDLGRVTAGHAKLGPAHRIDVGALRHVRSAKKAARKHVRAALPTGKSVDAKLLVLAPNAADPSYAWWTAALKTEGVPYDAIITRDQDISAATLQVDANHGRYEGVILTSGSLVDWSTGSAVQTMTTAEWAALATYEQAFAVRELNAYDYPQPAFGTNWGGKCGDSSGLKATVTPAGAAVFTDLAGSFPVDNGVYGCQTTPLAGSAWLTLVSGPSGAIVGTTVRSDGVETMFDSFSGADWTTYTRLLAHGMLGWVTKGVYLGLHRDYFRIDVDDVFYSNDRWDPATHLLNPDENSVIRMDASDVLRAVQWERSSGIQLNLLFNADGAAPTQVAAKPVKPVQPAKTPAKGKGVSKNKGNGKSNGKGNGNGNGKNFRAVADTTTDQSDPLTDALLLVKDQFRWTSHTFTHAELDPADQATIQDEITQNIDFATKYKLPFDKTELTTGGHSGLANANMPAALDATGIKSFGADQSRQPVQYALGGAQSIPRWPTGIYYNVGTKAEAVDEYNYLNYTICGTGPACLKAPADWNTLVSNEATMIVRHILDNDPRPHYMHQSNLAEEGTLYPVADEVLRRFHSYVNTPLVQLTQSEAGQTLAQQAAWNAALAAGKVSATITAGGITVNSSIPNLMVPATGIRNGTLYGGLKSGWTKVASGTTQLGV